MPGKLTNRQLQSLKRHQQSKGRRAELQEARRLRQLAKSQRRDRPPRQRDWSDADEAQSYEKMRPARVADTVPSRGVRLDQPPEPALAGTVTEVLSGESRVSVDGRVVRAILPPAARVSGGGMRSPVVVGDRVAIEPVDRGLVRITSVLPRRSGLLRQVSDPSRRDPNTQGQVLAANIDQVLVVCSPAEPPYRSRLIDRYLVAASRDGLPAVVCLNKTDLGVPDEVEASLRGYQALGVRIVRSSALSGDGMEAVRDCIAGKVSLFSGHSGVGKSSLLNAIEPGLALQVGGVTESAAGQGKGRHTTSSARLIPLSAPETYVVDSPGIRSFGISGLAARDLASHFPDIAELAPGCAYRDCLHRAEPDCAVRAAAHLDPFLKERVASYKRMLVELA